MREASDGAGPIVSARYDDGDMAEKTPEYEPLNTLKPVGDQIWLIDGPIVRFYGLPFPTRCTVVRLDGGGLWVHSPTALTEGLKAELADLGPVEHLVAPNWIHYVSVGDWQQAYPDAKSWAAPGVSTRAAKHGLALRFDHELGSHAETPWAGQIRQRLITGSKVHSEAVFFHKASRTLILTDLIENFEAERLPWWMRPLARLGGVLAPNGGMPRDMRTSFAGHRGALKAQIEELLSWAPLRVIFAHGRWFETDGAARMRAAYRWLLD